MSKRQEENRLYQIMMETNYGLTPPQNSISPPDSNTNISNKEQGVNMVESQLPSILDKIQPAIDLLEEIVSLGLEVFKELFDGVSCTDWILHLIIRNLAQSIRFIPIT